MAKFYIEYDLQKKNDQFKLSNPVLKLGETVVLGQRANELSSKALKRNQREINWLVFTSNFIDDHKGELLGCWWIHKRIPGNSWLVIKFQYR